MRDRAHGFALLAEALSHAHPTGKFHEFVRFVELALGLSSSALAEPLGIFLEAARNQGFSRGESLQWVVHLRHPATHADLLRQQTFLLGADVWPVIPRVEQAAYDVLFNKADWHAPTATRTQPWTPPAVIGAG